MLKSWKSYICTYGTAKSLTICNFSNLVDFDVTLQMFSVLLKAWTHALM